MGRNQTLFGESPTQSMRMVLAPLTSCPTGGLYDIHIHLSLPDKREVAVERTPHLDERFQRFEFALHDAFNRAVRQLQDQVGEMRGKVKVHDEQPTGVVKKLLPEDGYGFLESADGRAQRRCAAEWPGLGHDRPLFTACPLLREKGKLFGSKWGLVSCVLRGLGPHAVTSFSHRH